VLFLFLRSKNNNKHENGMSAFEGKAAFKGRNVLNTATKRSENLIRQFKFFRVPDPDLKSDTIKNNSPFFRLFN